MVYGVILGGKSKKAVCVFLIFLFLLFDFGVKLGLTG